MTCTTIHLNSEEKALLERIAEEVGASSRHALIKRIIRCVIKRYLEGGPEGVRAILDFD